MRKRETQKINLMVQRTGKKRNLKYSSVKQCRVMELYGNGLEFS